MRIACSAYMRPSGNIQPVGGGWILNHLIHLTRLSRDTLIPTALEESSYHAADQCERTRPSFRRLLLRKLFYCHVGACCSRHSKRKNMRLWLEGLTERGKFTAWPPCCCLVLGPASFISSTGRLSPRTCLYLQTGHLSLSPTTVVFLWVYCGRQIELLRRRVIHSGRSPNQNEPTCIEIRPVVFFGTL